MNRVAARRVGASGLVAVLGAVCACARATSVDPAQLNANQAWVASTCGSVTPDTAGWPRYRLGSITIAVPAEYRLSVRHQFSIAFGRGSASLGLLLERDARPPLGNPATLLDRNRCSASYSGFPTHAYSRFGLGDYTAWAIWDDLNTFGDRPRVRAVIRATRLRDAELLRQTLHTIAIVADTR